MSEEQDKLGTPGSQAGDAPVTEETAGAASKDGQGGLPPEDISKLNLAWKNDAEAERKRAATLEAENRALRERLEQPPAAPAEESDDYWAGVAEFAADRTDAQGRKIKGDPVAKALLRDREDRFKAELEKQYNAIEDEGERKAALDLFRKRPDIYGNITAAHAQIAKDRLASENDELRKKLAASARKPDPDTVQTHSREVSASEHKIRQMSKAEWAQERSRLRDSDPAAGMQMDRDRRAGRIRVP